MLQSTLIAFALLSGVHAYRVKRSQSASQSHMEAELLKRSSQNQSSESQQLDEAVSGKPKSKNGWCLPHQQCTYSDCCSWGSSCKTCPGGSSDYSLVPLFSFKRCTWKGHFYCNALDCQGYWDQDWTVCSAECGGGEQKKYFTLTHHPSLGGAECPEVRVQTQACNAHECAPVDCQGDWSGEWSECSATCGEGTKTMHFVKSADAKYGGQCEETKTEACNVQECGPSCPPSPSGMPRYVPDGKGNCEDNDTGEHADPACCAEGEGGEQDAETNYDCQGAWSDYTACSTTCGDGEQMRTYRVTTPRKGEGAECPESHGATETKACNLQESCCPAKTFRQSDTECIDQSAEEWWLDIKKVPMDCCENGVQLG